MKKIILSFYLLFAFNLIGAQNIEGKWLFESIRFKNIDIQKDLKPIAEGDFMLIEKDGAFKYELSSIPLQAEGNWKLKEDILSFQYTSPNDTTRYYKISLSENTLVLNENGINFSFQKAEVVPIATSGFSIISLFRGILGIISLLLIAFLFSRNRKGIDWKLIMKGLGIQILFALLILKAPIVSSGF